MSFISGRKIVAYKFFWVNFSVFREYNAQILRLYKRAIRFKNTVEDVTKHILPVRWLHNLDDFIGVMSGTDVILKQYEIIYASQIVSSTHSVSSVDVKVACSLILRSTCCSADSSMEHHSLHA